MKKKPTAQTTMHARVISCKIVDVVAYKQGCAITQRYFVTLEREPDLCGSIVSSLCAEGSMYICMHLFICLWSSAITTWRVTVSKLIASFTKNAACCCRLVAQRNVEIRSPECAVLSWWIRYSTYIHRYLLRQVSRIAPCEDPNGKSPG